MKMITARTCIGFGEYVVATVITRWRRGWRRVWGSHFEMDQTQRQTLCDLILNETMAPDVEMAKLTCTYRFNTRRTPPPVTTLGKFTHKFLARNDIDMVPSDEQLLRFYSLGSYFCQLMEVLGDDDFVIIYNREIINCHDNLRAMETVRTLAKMEELFGRFREDLRTIAYRVRQM